MTLLIYRCRDNKTHSLLASDGRPRLEQFCPTCQPLTLGLCCLLDDAQTMCRMRALKLEPDLVIRCATCRRVNPETEFKNCPRCREDARRRMRRLK
jgi:hypothetical protein